MFSKKFKKGKYYIGDPCYVVEKQDKWMELLEKTNYFKNEEQEYKGYPILAGSTAYGDGVYGDNEGRIYCVDAGLIGIMPIECIDKKHDNIEDLGNIVEFEDDFDVSIEDGVFEFGNILINTIWDEDEDEDEDD